MYSSYETKGKKEFDENAQRVLLCLLYVDDEFTSII